MKLNLHQVEELIRVHSLPLNRKPARLTDYRRGVCRETVAALQELLELRKATHEIKVEGVVR